MKKIFTLMLALACAMFAGVSCTPDNGLENDDEVKASVVTVTGAPEANLAPEAGEFTLNYAIQNATLTGALEVTSSAAWVHVGEIGEATVAFTYDANTDAPGAPAREAVISFAYTDAETVSVSVKQDSQAASFEIVWDETTLSCNYAAYTVKSEVNPEMLYLATTSADLMQYGVQGETVAEKMANYVTILTTNYMLGTEVGGTWEGDNWFYFKGNMEYPKELYRADANDIEVYVAGFEITNTESDSWGTYATAIQLTTPVHVSVAPFLPFPVIAVDGELEKTVAAAAGSVDFNVAVENPIEGNDIMVSTEASWVVPNYADGKLTVAYEANTAALPRKATINVDYGKMGEYGWPETVAQQVVLTLTQEADANAEKVTFDIQVVETHFNGIIVNVTPSNLEVDYYLNTVAAKDWEGNDAVIDWLTQVTNDVKWGADEAKCFKGALNNHRIVMSPGNYEWTGYDFHVYAFALNAEKTAAAGEASHVLTTVDASDMPSLAFNGGGLVWSEEDGRYDLTVSKAGDYTFNYEVTNPVEGASVQLNGTKISDSNNLVENDDQPIFDHNAKTITLKLNGYPTDWSKTWAPYVNIYFNYKDDSGEYWGVQAQIKITWVEDPGMQLPYQESFENGIGNFTIDNVLLGEGLSYVWKHENGKYGYYMKASAFAGSAKDSESWLVSPKIDLSAATMPGLQFSHTHKFAGDATKELTLWVKEWGAADWTQVTIPVYGTNNDYNFVTAAVDLSAWAGKKVQIGFKYTSSTSAAGTWEVKDVVVYDAGGVAM